MPDYLLVRSWVPNAAPCKAPCVAHYEDGAKQLSFVASRHRNDLSSDSFKLIRSEFQKFGPEVVVIECLPFGRGFSPKRYVDGIRQDPSSKFWKLGESSYVAMLAVEGGIRFIGGEPTYE